MTFANMNAALEGYVRESIVNPAHAVQYRQWLVHEQSGATTSFNTLRSFQNRSAVVVPFPVPTTLVHFTAPTDRSLAWTNFDHGLPVIAADDSAQFEVENKIFHPLETGGGIPIVWIHSAPHGGRQSLARTIFMRARDLHGDSLIYQLDFDCIGHRVVEYMKEVNNFMKEVQKLRQPKRLILLISNATVPEHAGSIADCNEIIKGITDLYKDNDPKIMVMVTTSGPSMLWALSQREETMVIQLLPPNAEQMGTYWFDLLQAYTSGQAGCLRRRFEVLAPPGSFKTVVAMAIDLQRWLSENVPANSPLGKHQVDDIHQALTDAHHRHYYAQSTIDTTAVEDSRYAAEVCGLPETDRLKYKTGKCPSTAGWRAARRVGGNALAGGVVGGIVGKVTGDGAFDGMWKGAALTGAVSGMGAFKDYLVG